MRIVFDVTPLSHPRTGVGNYVRGSLAGLAQAAAGKHDVVAWAPTSAAGARLVAEALEGIPVERRIKRLPFAHAWRTLWSRAARPPAERFVGPFDVLHFSDWMYPPQRAGVRSTMIHDLVPLRFPEWTTPRTRSMHSAKYRNAARTCDLLFVNSEYTGRETVELLGVSPERIRVARPGVEPRFRPEGERADLGRPYAVTVATLEPRKNLETLLAAHQLDPHGLALAVVGGAGWGAQPDLHSDDVLALGFVGHDELPRYYRGADVLVVPSRFEGFGMTVVEGMACGVPCVVSSHPSLDEACGDAAVRVDPEDAEAIASGIGEALARRDELRRLGLEHARSFTWRACGDAMLAAFEEAA
ncbi:MAG: glycosyltransferase family 4 protein [Actinomycetota bacterium]|nr:glycosyltransferase family 4 protein [Actinomycetota bacterium]